MDEKEKDKAGPPGEAIELWKQYPPSKYNLLLPTRTIQEHISPVHKSKLEIVQLTEADIYEVGGSGLYAIHKSGLQKFGAAVGVNWPGDKCKLISDDGVRVVFQATGECRRNDGTWQEYSRTYSLDLRDIEDETRKKYTDKADKALRAAKKGERLPTGLTDETRETWINKQTDRDVSQIRKFRVQRAESGAMNRVIMDILTIKGGYKKEQILLPFVMPRIVFSPDFEKNPEAKRALIEEATRASGALYGGRTETQRALPVHQGVVIPAEATPADGNGNGGETAEKGKPEAPAQAEPARPAPDPKPDPEKPAPAPAPPAEPPIEERFPKMDAKGQADAIRSLVKEVDWKKPFKPDIEKWKPEYRAEFFGVLMAKRKEMAEADRPY